MTLGQAYLLRQDNFLLVRLLAAWLVIYGHASAITGNPDPDIILQALQRKFAGGVGVDMLFIVSGFLVTSSAAAGKGMVYFLGARLLRLYPGLLVCVAATVLILGPLVTLSPEHYWTADTWRYFWSNGLAWQTVQTLPGVFVDHPLQGVNGSIWSLVLEVRLYFATALITVLGLVARPRVFNTVFFVTLTLAVFSPEWRGLLIPDSWQSLSLMYAFGTFYFVNREEIRLDPFWLLALLVLTAASLTTALQAQETAFVVLYPFVLSYLTFYVVYGFVKVPWSSRIGDYSYGVYLYGWPMQQVTWMVWPSLSNLEHALVAGGLSLLIGILTWHTFEERLLNLKHHLPQRAFG